MLKLLLLISSLVLPSHAKLTFDSIIATSDPHYANFTSVISKFSKSETVLNVTIDYGYEVSRMTVLFTLAVPKDQRDKNYEKVVINSNVNVCRMLQGITGDFMTKTIMDELHKCVDFEMKCPLPKGSLHIYNFIIKDKYIPTFLINDNLKYYIMAKVMGKVPDHKSMVHLFTVKAFGEILKA